MHLEFQPSRSENIPDLEFHVIVAEFSTSNTASCSTFVTRFNLKSKFQYVSIEEY